LFLIFSVNDKAPKRFWEIDVLRGIAIIMMIIYHISFDLTYFHIVSLPLQSLSWQLFLFPIGTLFLLLVGISLTLSYTRIKNIYSSAQLRLKFLLRGSRILALGFLITLATWIYPHKGFIVFGVLHCIGVSIIIAFPLLNKKWANLLLGLLCVTLGLYVRTITIQTDWFVWLGLTSPTFSSLDYFPLLPWCGVVFLGLFLGNTLYKDYRRRFHLQDLSHVLMVRFLVVLGKHSLLIYLLHQPIIIGILYLLVLR
jgi:uncharacterized membrane protein